MQYLPRDSKLTNSNVKSDIVLCNILSTPVQYEKDDQKNQAQSCFIIHMTRHIQITLVEWRRAQTVQKWNYFRLIHLQTRAMYLNEATLSTWTILLIMLSRSVTRQQS